MKELLALLVFVAIGVLFSLGATYWVGSYGCDSLQKETGFPTKYRSLTCYVQVKGQWVPESAWRVEH